ncbi:hypothetical protein K438DRAFT_2004837 [Mycena galopus ATCC 62051]|nr:hypothetical protein K438DRAFT_2004837 [Mycena galopus ATCC 62051]
MRFFLPSRISTQRPLPERLPETTAGVFLSHERAADHVLEARAEHQAQRACAAQDLIAQLEREGLPEYLELRVSDFDATVAWDLAKYVITNFYAAPRLAKIMRAHVRRYLRLKHEWELIHPPFSHPEFPEDPRHRLWSTNSGRHWGDPTVDHPPQLLTEADDAVSPVIIRRRLFPR